MKKFVLLTIVLPYIALSQEAVSAILTTVQKPLSEVVHVALQNPITPVAVLDNFAKNHPKINACWGLGPSEYTARYKEPSTGLLTIVVYDRSGNIVRQESEVDESAMPGGIPEFIDKKCRGEKVTVWSCMENTELSYYAKHKNRIYWFDEKGVYKKSVKNWFGYQKKYM